MAISPFSAAAKTNPVNWPPVRAMTPGNLWGYEDANGLQFVAFSSKTHIQFYHAENNSHGLIISNNQTVGASVCTEIKTEKKRKDEIKKTFVQYDKTRINQENADFTVNPYKNKTTANYSGGHLIGHQHSAENSHTDPQNYFPTHHFYNTPLKEYLIDRSEFYIEIPLYTSNPPQLGVKGNQRTFQSIPVGVVFVQINHNKIEDIYYFPNNKFDYQALKKTVSKKPLSFYMLPYFKLKPELHPLLQPAIISNFLSEADLLTQQSTREKSFCYTVAPICNGISSADYPEKNEVISHLAYSILHTGGDVDPALCLACTKEQYEKIQTQHLETPFKALGRFLIQYGVQNALKSEVISVKIRLVFANTITSLIASQEHVTEEALDFIGNLSKEFKRCVKELDAIQNTMSLKPLLYLANTYQRLSNKHNPIFPEQAHCIYKPNERTTYFQKSMQILETIVSKYSIDDFDENLAIIFLIFIKDAHTTLRSMIEKKVPEELLTKGKNLLKKIRPYAIELLQKQESSDGVIRRVVWTNIGREEEIEITAPHLIEVLNTS